MINYSRKVRILFLLLAGTFAGIGVYAHSRTSRLPYGREAAPALCASGLLLSLGTFLLFLRSRSLWLSLSGEKPFELGVSQIPKREAHTYIARGFPWEGTHVERLQELTLSGLRLPARVSDRIAGNWLIHGVGAAEARDIYIPDALLNQHLYVLGAPGSGKTRFLELLIEQAVRRGEAVVVIDPKGDERLLDRTYDSAVRHGRAGDFRTLALPYPYQSARYNPVLNYTRPSEIADRLALVLPRGGESEAFRNFAWTFMNILVSALAMLGEEITLAKLNAYCFYDTWRLVRKLIYRVHPDAPDGKNEDVVKAYRAFCASTKRSYAEIDALIGMAELKPDYFGKVTSALRPILGKLTAKGVGYLLSPGDVLPPPDLAGAPKPPEISWHAIDSNRLIVYFFLGSLIGEDTASAVARLTLADLQSHVGKKYAYQDPTRFSRMTVIVDEVGDALCAESVNLLNKARGAGLSLVLAGQSIADLEVALGSHSDARRALANVGSFITLRAANPEDARYFSEKCGERPLRHLSEGESYEPALFSSGRSNIDDFAYRTSRQLSMKNETLVPTWAIDELPRFHFFATWGGRTYKGMLPLLADPVARYSPTLKESFAPAAEKPPVVTESTSTEKAVPST